MMCWVELGVTAACRRSWPVSAQALLLGALMVALGGCRGASAGGTAAAAAPPEVGVATVLSRRVPQWEEFNGRLSAIGSVTVRPRVSGYIDKVVYREGGEVEKGDLLFVIDPRPYRDAVKEAQAQLERARAARELARLQEARAQVLVGAKAISREEFDDRHGALTQASASERAAEAALATAELNLGFTEVRAPVAGRAGGAMLRAGNLVQANETELTTVVPQDPMYVQFECDEHTYLRYNELKLRGRVGGVRVALADERGFTHSGSLDFLDNHVDPSTGTIRARAVLPNADRVLVPGLYARVRLEVGSESEALLIDDKAVMTDQDRKYVYVLGPNDAAVRKDVVLGRLVEGLRVVQSGLQARDRVIVRGLQSVLFPGMRVKPVAATVDETTAGDSGAAVAATGS